MIRKLLFVPLVVVVTLVALNFTPPALPYIIGPQQSAAARQVSYAKKHYDSPNTKHYADLKKVDCANFVSQTLIARGWKMDEHWWSKKVDGKDTFSKPWISSTALHNYLKARPYLAKQLSWSQRYKVVVGDIVQFDWDASGDRDHTAVVSGILVNGKSRELLITSHSPGTFNRPITEELANRSPKTKVYFWHLND